MIDAMRLAAAFNPAGIPLNSPGGRKPFHPDPAPGDLAVVIHKGTIAAAICGDMGPYPKIGEDSIRLH